jgi:hypothetical protein
MAALAQLAFVAAPSATPTINLNLDQPGLVKVKADSFDLGSPSFDGQPYSVGAEYGERTVSFTLQVTGTYAAAMAAMQLVSRQLATPNPSQQAPTLMNRNWLMFRWQPSSDPMFLRAFTTAPESLNWENAGVGVWELPMSLLCDAFIVGPREDMSSVTITSDPSTGTNRLRADLGTVKGDVETPAYIWRSLAAHPNVDGIRSLLVCETGAAVANPPVMQAESATAGTDTSTVADATASGGNKTRTTFATASLVSRLVNIALPAGGPNLYRLYVRVASTVNTSTYQMKYREGSAASIYETSVVTYTPLTANQWEFIDLGLFQLPPGASLRENGLTGSTPGRDPVGTPGTFYASRETGAGSLDVDYIVAVPAGGQVATVMPNFPLGASSYLVFDGYADEVTSLVTAAPLSGSANYTQGVTYAKTGMLPTLTPGVTNRLWYVDIMGNAATAGNLISQTATLNVSYWPRYLYARPDAD